METKVINLTNMSKGIIIKKVSINDILESIPNYDNIDELNTIIKACNNQINKLNNGIY